MSLSFYFSTRAIRLTSSVLFNTDGHAALLAAYKLRRQMRVAAELVAATEKIDPSGIRTAVQTAKANGAPHSTVVAAEEKLRALEDEISAFIRAKRRTWVGFVATGAQARMERRGPARLVRLLN